ncbi:MAG: type III-B CRISPR module-associated protein Cmr5 [Vulcanimicrobiaceae bacterium]
MRALRAYEAVGSVPSEKRADYKGAINDLGANIMRSGLSAALASLERKRKGCGGIILEQLAKAGIPGLEKATRDDLPKSVRVLDAEAYMLATRELLKFAAWLKRAAQATIGED